MLSRLRSRSLLLAFALVLNSPILHAATIGFTDPVAFQAALPVGGAQTLDFDSLPAGTLLPSGSTTQSGITFAYSIAGLTMKVTDAFSTTSDPNALGLTGGDEAFLDGDAFDLGFTAPQLAIGMFFITSDPAIANEILLSAGGGTIGNAAVPFSVLPDGGLTYFLGLIADAPFSAASVDFLQDGEINFAFNVDDITTAVPEPSTGVLLAVGLMALRAPARQLRRRAVASNEARSVACCAGALSRRTTHERTR